MPRPPAGRGTASCAAGALGYSAILTKGVLFSQQSRWDTLGRILEPLVSKVPTLASQG
jgi:hypothetical protein